MAIRFGGKYSPDGQPGNGPAAGTGLARPAPGQVRHRYESRTKWVTVMAAPLLLGAFFQGDPMVMASSLLGFGIIAAGMWMTREVCRPRPPMTPAASRAARQFRASCSAVS